MRHLFGAALAASALAFAAAPAQAEDVHFLLINQSGYDLYEFYASPTDVSSWEEDILGADILATGESVEVIIADGRTQCDYDLRMVFEDGDVLEDTVNVCETGSYTIE
jgi:hypothetical protein